MYHIGYIFAYMPVFYSVLIIFWDFKKKRIFLCPSFEGQESGNDLAVWLWLMSLVGVAKLLAEASVV